MYHMRKFQILAGLAVVASIFVATTAQAQIELGPYPAGLSDDKPSLVYNPADGALSIAMPGDTKWSTLEMISPNGMFTGTATPGLVLPPFDVFSPTKYFLLKTTGLGDQELGAALAPGLSGAALAAELEVNGSVLPSGPLSIDLLVVPEPSSIVMIGLGLVGLAGLRRKRA
jgi:hypothetical protein